MEKILNINRLKACREALGITKQEAAKRINVSQPTYLRYESGERHPSIQVISEIAKAFNTSVDYLTGASDDIEADYLFFGKTEEPLLFELVKKCKSMDKERIKKLLESIQ